MNEPCRNIGCNDNRDGRCITIYACDGADGRGMSDTTRQTLRVIDRPELRALTAEGEVERLRALNTALHRRCQKAEAAVCRALVLHLVLTYHWYDEIAAGRKLIEYRACTPHWTRLIWDRRARITHAKFRRGYTSASITRRVAFIDIGPCPYDGWSGNYYRIHMIGETPA